jgi:putative flippase GtrA
MNNSFTRYLFIGGLNFLADLAVLELLSRQGVPLFAARIISMAAALPVIFLVHRAFTFRAKHIPMRRAFPRYVASCAFGMSVNYIVFLLAALWLPRLHSLIIATAISMWVNYYLNRRHVFRHEQD